MIRAACAALVLLATLPGCAGGLSQPTGDNGYAPGVDHRKEAVDGLIVGNRLLEAKQYELALDAFTRAAADQGMTGEIYAGIGAANAKMMFDGTIMPAFYKSGASPVLKRPRAPRHRRPVGY